MSKEILEVLGTGTENKRTSLNATSKPYNTDDVVQGICDSVTHLSGDSALS
ncbi:MAG: hypothetical protein KAS01_01455 [Candidatus Pacebacteria bacterium]|nr:hypothetical protein [Candidatus Paceibacterota bacterium]